MNLQSGWIRDGSKYIEADLSAISLRTMGGEDGLRFQLEHSGLNASEIGIILNALREGAD